MVESAGSGIRERLSGSVRRLLPISQVLSDSASRMVAPLCLISISAFSGPSFILIGLMEGLSSLAVALVHVISPSVYGLRRDRAGIFPYLLSGISTLLLAAGSTILSVVSARVVSEIGEESHSNISPLRKPGQGKASSPISLVSSLAGPPILGSILGPMILFIMLVPLFASGSSMLPGFLAGSSALALALAILALMAFVVASFFRKQDADAGSPPPRVSISALFSPKRGRGVIIVCLLLSIAAISPFFFLFRILADSGLINMLLCYLAFGLSRSLFSPGVILLGTRLGEKKTLSLGAACLVLSMCVFFFFPVFPLLLQVLAFSLLGLSMSVLSSIPFAFISLSFGKDKAGPALAAYRTIAALAGFPANIIAALLWGVAAFNAPSSILFSLIVSALALGLLVFAFEDK